jgi:hypothetical protein
METSRYIISLSLKFIRKDVFCFSAQYIRKDKKISIVLLRNKIIWGYDILRNKFWRVAGSYAQYDDSEDIFSISMDAAFPLQYLLLVPSMVMSKWSSFSLFRNLKFCHYLQSNIPMIMLVKVIREFFYLKCLRLSVTPRKTNPYDYVNHVFERH